MDEMRVGLLGQSRRVWGKRGETVRQRVELRYDWAYLVLGVDPIRKRLMWAWLERVRGVELAEVVRQWKAQGVVGLVWDNAAFHRSRAVGEVDVSAALFA